MMDAGGIQKLRESFRAPELLERSDKHVIMAPVDWKEITPAKPPEPTMLGMQSLGGVTGYLGTNVDKLALAEVVVHVTDFQTVTVRGKLEGEDTQFRRPWYLMAKAPSLEFKFGVFMDHESFIIALQTQFKASKNRDDLLTMIASIKDSTVAESIDNSVAQEVNVNRGLKMATETVQSVHMLEPFRTFREITQPASEFVIRLRAGAAGSKPQCALFEADGGVWKLKAVEDIATWIKNALQTVAPNVPVIW